MWQRLSTFFSRLFQIIGSLVMMLLVGATTGVLWYFYGEERLKNQFIREGQVVEVVVDEVDSEYRSWRDALSNSRYLHFRYRNKPYEVHYIQDTVWIAAGNRVRLTYHPQMDAFQQIRVGKPAHGGQKQSRLVNWSSSKGASTENALLGSLLFVGSFLALLTCGFLFLITNWSLIQVLGQAVGFLMLLGGAVFFSYDAWSYYQYHQHIRKNGQPVQVTVLNTHQRMHGRRKTHWYTYEATVRHENAERVIPIEESDYESLKPGTSLAALYDRELDDMMATSHSSDWAMVLIPAFFWLFVAGALGVWGRKRRSARA